MSRPRSIPRPTLRRLLAAWAVLSVIAGTVAATWWLIRTSDACQRRADGHARLAAQHEANRSAAIASRSGREARLADHHARMNQKWEYAASHPWLAVPADPPEPR